MKRLRRCSLSLFNFWSREEIGGGGVGVCGEVWTGSVIIIVDWFGSLGGETEGGGVPFPIGRESLKNLERDGGAGGGGLAAFGA